MPYDQNKENRKIIDPNDPKQMQDSKMTMLLQEFDRIKEPINNCDQLSKALWRDPYNVGLLHAFTGELHSWFIIYHQIIINEGKEKKFNEWFNTCKNIYSEVRPYMEDIEEFFEELETWNQTLMLIYDNINVIHSKIIGLASVINVNRIENLIDVPDDFSTPPEVTYQDVEEPVYDDNNPETNANTN